MKPDDSLEVREEPDGFTLHPRRVDLSKLGTLRDRIDPDHEPFDLEQVRSQPYDPSLRD